MVAHLTGISQGSLTLHYLCCLLFKGRKTKATFHYLLDNIHKKIMGWSGKRLSPGGRLMLIKHVLSSTPVYVLSALNPPISILTADEQLFSIIFWGSDDDGRQRRSWRAWQSLAFRVAENGLGVRRLQEVCLAFLAKLQ